MDRIAQAIKSRFSALKTADPAVRAEAEGFAALADAPASTKPQPHAEPRRLAPKAKA